MTIVAHSPNAGGMVNLSLSARRPRVRALSSAASGSVRPRAKREFSGKMSLRRAPGISCASPGQHDQCRESSCPSGYVVGLRLSAFFCPDDNGNACRDNMVCDQAPEAMRTVMVWATRCLPTSNRRESSMLHLRLAVNAPGCV